jgi:hypothetical protein
VAQAAFADMSDTASVSDTLRRLHVVFDETRSHAERLAAVSDFHFRTMGCPPPSELHLPASPGQRATLLTLNGQANASRQEWLLCSDVSHYQVLSNVLYRETGPSTFAMSDAPPRPAEVCDPRRLRIEALLRPYLDAEEAAFFQAGLTTVGYARMLVGRSFRFCAPGGPALPSDDASLLHHPHACPNAVSAPEGWVPLLAVSPVSAGPLTPASAEPLSPASAEPLSPASAEPLSPASAEPLSLASAEPPPPPGLPGRASSWGGWAAGGEASSSPDMEWGGGFGSPLTCTREEEEDMEERPPPRMSTPPPLLLLQPPSTPLVWRSLTPPPPPPQRTVLRRAVRGSGRWVIRGDDVVAWSMRCFEAGAMQGASCASVCAPSPSDPQVHCTPLLSIHPLLSHASTS